MRMTGSSRLGLSARLRLWTICVGRGVRQIETVPNDEPEYHQPDFRESCYGGNGASSGYRRETARHHTASLDLWYCCRRLVANDVESATASSTRRRPRSGQRRAGAARCALRSAPYPLQACQLAQTLSQGGHKEADARGIDAKVAPALAAERAHVDLAS
jgi:hypothetical protein